MRVHHPKVPLLTTVSPIEHLPNLSKHLGPNIFIKRDDIGGRAGGGNKLRKYERILADAIANKCDTLIIAGHVQSNASRALVGAARQYGLDSVVVAKKMIPEQNSSFNRNGNALLMQLMQASIVEIETEANFEDAMTDVAKTIEQKGGKPYLIPFGGSNVLGALGYVACANEIIEQKKELQIDIGQLYVASGSGGTQAGLITGFQMQNSKTKVKGVSVLHNRNTLEDTVTQLVSAIMQDQNHPEINSQDICTDDCFIGEGYGIPTVDAVNAIHLLAQLEAIFLCPVYTGKAMAALISDCKQGKISSKDTVLFIHTGGFPLVFPYYDQY